MSTPRYLLVQRKVAVYWDDDAPLIPNLQVDMVSPKETGLWGPPGEAVYRMPEPIGFVASEDE